ncbi:MAG: small-conductance mechanosensitive channel [Planctomycetota bacterium]|jgi:small-conductance mechanosensitive channel
MCLNVADRFRILILFDRPFQVGDRVEFGGHYGDVTMIGLRSVKLQTLDDNTITVPNNLFLTEISSSGNYGALEMQVAVTFHIGLDQNVNRAVELAEEATVTSRFIHLPRPIVVVVDQVIVDSYIALRLVVKAYVLDTQYEKAYSTDITLRVMQAFQDEGIAPPAVLHRQQP